MANGSTSLHARQTIEALKVEVATYKHAFETTAADRDRLLEELRSFEEPANSTAPVITQAEETSTYGRYWQGPTDLHRELLKSSSGKTPTEIFRALISTGFVLQHAVAARREHVERLIAWQIEGLRDSGIRLDQLDVTMCELDILPDSLLFDIANRRVSTDFVRFYEYFVRIRQTIPLPDRPLVFEIGSGYGGLARIIKLHHPGCALLLLDIEETLRGAEIYLRHAFPGAVIRHFTPAHPMLPESGEIVLCRIEDAQHLTGMTADLAINTWSFGEMPNRYIDQWFTFLNDANTTRAIFLINHFMMPVCLESPTARAQLQSAQWLSHIDDRWDVVDFEIHPGSHRSPYWRHCQQGLCVAAKLFESESAKQRAIETARASACDVYLEDWAQCSIDASSADGDPQRQRIALLSAPGATIDETTVFNMTQVENVLGIIKDDIRFDQRSAFFLLWNDYRLAGSRASLRLLRILLYLKWRPALKNPTTGRPYSVISGEEHEFGTLVGGTFAGDPALVVPGWLAMRFKNIFGASA
jgi:hypothetical protein